MRIVNRQQFLDLPAGTLCSVWEGYDHTRFSNGLFVKGDSIRHSADDKVGDFFYEDLFDTLCWSEACECLEAGSEVPALFDEVGRDGCFDSDTRYLVFGRSDVSGMIIKLHECAKVST
jgi:hypothetical protein